MKSGLPPRDPLYNGSICRTFATARPGQGYNSEVPHTGAPVLVAPPAILPRVTPERPGIWRRTMHDTVFLNNRGDLTSYAPNGFRRFQARWGRGGTERLVGARRMESARVAPLNFPQRQAVHAPCIRWKRKGCAPLLTRPASRPPVPFTDPSGCAVVQRAGWRLSHAPARAPAPWGPRGGAAGGRGGGGDARLSGGGAPDRVPGPFAARRELRGDGF